MIPANARNLTIPDCGYNGVRLRAIADQIPQADDLIDGELMEPVERRIQRPHIAVYVRDQSNPHGIEPGLFWW
jgi:hypothetical protein